MEVCLEWVGGGGVLICEETVEEAMEILLYSISNSQTGNTTTTYQIYVYTNCLLCSRFRILVQTCKVSS